MIAMKNINENETITESDLEEGEIPEFEVCQNGNSEDLDLKEGEKNQPTQKVHLGCAPDFGRIKDNPMVRIPNLPHGCLKKNSVYFPNDKGRYELPSMEGEYISDISKNFMRNQVPQNTYNYDVAERRLKYLHPFQATYGSVEHIMTKIGETLGRSNDCYYKGRRINDPRSFIGSTFRESGSLLRKFRSSYHKKRRYSKGDSESDREIWEERGKIKSGNSIELRRKEEKDFRKKRKAKFSNLKTIVSETKKSIACDKSVSTCNDLSAESTFGGNERLLKPIRELQERESGGIEAQEMSLPDDNPNTIPQFSTALVSEKDVEKPASSGAINSDDNQESRNYEDLSEKSSVVEEDSDDDVELIKLRLLALTSNKRKNHVLTEEKANDAAEKLGENLKSELTDDEKTPAPNDVMVCKDNEENDIDRYELMLREEALKTALFKKHKHMVKKRKYSLCSLSIGPDQNNDNPESLESQVGPSDEADEKKDEEDSFPAQDYSVDTSVTTTGSKNENISETQSNLVRTTQNGSLGPKSPSGVVMPKGCHVLNQVSNQICEDARGVNQTGRKLKRRRLRKIKKFGCLNLAELSKKENNGVSSVTANECVNKTKALVSDYSDQKNTPKEHEKKFVLVDSTQLSKIQLSTDADQTDKSTVTTKSNGVMSTSLAKLPETEIERIIVHLGSDSSDEEASPREKSEAASSEVPEKTEPPSTSGDAHSKILDYEKSVELLLKDARRRIDENIGTSQKIPATPEAVYSHLAPSQRLEYIRLKKKIAETENLRKLKKNASTSQDTSANTQIKLRTCPTPETQKKEPFDNKTKFSVKNLSLKTNVSAIAGERVSAPSNNIKKIRNKNGVRVAVNEVNNDVRNGVMRAHFEGNFKSKNILNDLGTNLSPKNGSGMNSVSVVKKILERKKTLTQNRLHLERLKILWKNIKMEKMIEEKCLNELKRLKIQQNFFELKVSQQRTKIKKLAEESKQIYEAFQKMNKGLEMSGKKKKIFITEKSNAELSGEVTRTNVGEECSKSETIGHVDDVPGPQKKEGNLVEKNRIANLEDKEPQTMEIIEVASTVIQAEQLKKYNSPLQRHSTGSESSSCHRVDPNTVMCQYDLTGRCNDEECPYQHVRC